MRIHLDPGSGPASCAGCSHSSSASHKEQILVDAPLEGGWVNGCWWSSCSTPTVCAGSALLVCSLKSQLCGTQPSSFLLAPLDHRLSANRDYYWLWICAGVFKPWNPRKFPFLCGSLLKWQELAGLHHQHQEQWQSVMTFLEVLGGEEEGAQIPIIWECT